MKCNTNSKHECIQKTRHDDAFMFGVGIAWDYIAIENQ